MRSVKCLVLLTTLFGTACSRSSNEIVFSATAPTSGLYVVGEQSTALQRTDDKIYIQYANDHTAYVPSLDILTGRQTMVFVDDSGRSLPLGLKGLPTSRDTVYFWPLHMKTDSFWIFVGTPAEYDDLHNSGKHSVGTFTTDFTP